MFDSAPNDTGMGGVSDDWLFSWNTQQEAAALPTPAFSSTPPTLSSSLTPPVFCSPLTPCGDKDTEPQLTFDFFGFGDQSICASDFNANPSLPDQGVSPPKVRTRDMFSEVLETVNARSAVAITEASASIAQLPSSPSPDLQSGVGVMMRRGSSPQSRSRSSSASSSSSSSSPSIPTQRGGQQDKKDGEGATIMVLENVGRGLMSEILLVVFKSKEQPKLKLYNQ
ncbi:hypothetical protein MPH_02760 [Macrophomina phaseolina MS6]|uniref:Uncharacterized protein n=1 Tax=Macrophomina phaseolina (strain MS6) TaxID=1126212 RepID=K2S4I9_MACPH|nr:hypothetical protein MPH_02760 [Macrophomina phaseolina MS6]